MALSSLLLSATLLPATHSLGTSVKLWATQSIPLLAAFFFSGIYPMEGAVSQTWHFAFPAPTLTHFSLAANVLHPLVSLNIFLGPCSSRSCYLYKESHCLPPDSSPCLSVSPCFTSPPSFKTERLLNKKDLFSKLNSKITLNRRL